jgi:hypothetical protein
LTPQGLLSPPGRPRSFCSHRSFPPIRCRENACELSESA